MSLGVIMLGDIEGNQAPQINDAMVELEEIMRGCLRKGDIVTRFSNVIFAMLLPTVNYQNSSAVMERIEQMFRQKYPDEKMPMYHRISLLGGLPG